MPEFERSDQERLAAREARYRQLATELASIGPIASGSLALRPHRCGKPNCACGADPPRLHGPYWHLTAKVEGKTVNRRLNTDEAELYQTWIANDRRLRSLTDEMRSVAQEIIELTLAAARADAKV
jgi:hypothetical protein